MLVTYLIYAAVAVVSLALLAIVVWRVSRRVRIIRCRRLLPYSDIEEQVATMNDYFGRNYVDGYILEYFKEGDNMKRALQARQQKQ